MTAISLHPLPRRGGIFREQLGAVGVAIRSETILFLAALVLLSILVLSVALRQAGNPYSHMGMGFGAQGAIPMTFVGLFIPFGVWRGEAPDRRAYHWAMPIARGPNTLIKTLCGWLWLMAAVVVYLLVIIGLSVVAAQITGGGTPDWPEQAWIWLVPFTSATVAYLLGSTAVLASDHPWRWIGGLFIGYLVVLGFMNALQLHDAYIAFGKILGGYYGLASALFASLESGPARYVSHAMEPLRHGAPSVNRWLGAAAIWGGLGAAGVVASSYLRRGGWG